MDGPAAHLRDPKIQGELAEKLQIQPDSISDWKKRDDFWEKVTTYCGVWVWEESSDVIEGLIKKAKYGAAPEVKLFLQFAGLFTETSHTEITGEDGGALELGIAGIVRKAAQWQLEAPKEDEGPTHEAAWVRCSASGQHHLGPARPHLNGSAE